MCYRTWNTLFVGVLQDLEHTVCRCVTGPGNTLFVGVLRDLKYTVGVLQDLKYTVCRCVTGPEIHCL